MGFSKPGSDIDHVPPDRAIPYFWSMWWLWWFFFFPWHRYVDSEHIKFIAEYNEDTDKFLGRSIYRSTMQYNEPEEIEKDWWIGYIGQFNESRTEIEIIYSMPPLTDSEFKQKYKEYGGMSNF